MTAETLKNIGFRDIGRWEKVDNERLRYELDGDDVVSNDAMLDVRNALYAFVRGDEVMYIGKTARSIKRRFAGYCNPGSTQQTNKRCHAKIQELLTRDTTVRVFVCTPPSELYYGHFQIDLAAGLEESLILAIKPPWNGSEGQRPITEEAEREATEAKVDQGLEPESPTSKSANRPVLFEVKLGHTYYNQGFINPGTEASRSLGKDGDPLIVYLGSRTEQVDSRINRTANINGAVRIVGNNRQIAEWFQKNFHQDDVVDAEVLDPNHILLRSKDSGSR
jgi:hypothetical protein